MHTVAALSSWSYCPGAQAVHWFAPSGEKLPPGHGRHFEALLSAANVPGLHGAQRPKVSLTAPVLHCVSAQHVVAGNEPAGVVLDAAWCTNAVPAGHAFVIFQASHDGSQHRLCAAASLPPSIISASTLRRLMVLFLQIASAHLRTGSWNTAFIMPQPSLL